MITVAHLGPEDARVVPRLDGGGTTRELWLWPEGRSEEGRFDLRVARADVTLERPLIEQAGCDRHLVVLGGSGLEVEHGEPRVRARLRPLEVYRLDGADPAVARPMRGGIEGLSVLARQGVVEAELEVLRLGARRARVALEGAHAFAHLAGGAAQARITGEEQPYELDAGHSLWIDGLAGGEELDLQGSDDETLAVVVRFTRKA